MRIEEYRGKTALADLRTNIQSMASETVSMRIAVGPEAEHVTNDAYLAAKACKHNPYNVVFDWATILQSAPVPLPKDS